VSVSWDRDGDSPASWPGPTVRAMVRRFVPRFLQLSRAMRDHLAKTTPEGWCVNPRDHRAPECAKETWLFAGADIHLRNKESARGAREVP